MISLSISGFFAVHRPGLLRGLWVTVEVASLSGVGPYVMSLVLRECCSPTRVAPVTDGAESQAVLLLPKRFILKLLAVPEPPIPVARQTTDLAKGFSVGSVDGQFLGLLVFRPLGRHARISAYLASALRCIDCWSGGGIGISAAISAVLPVVSVAGSVGDLSVVVLGSQRLALVIGIPASQVRCVLLYPS